MNGGVAVDIWGRSSLKGCYAIGEAAGTHGVTRPGGAALNAGQVFGLRCAQHIAARKRAASIDAPPRAILEAAIQSAVGGLHGAEGTDWREIEREVQARMSDQAGFICSAEGVRAALSDARKLNAKIRARGLRAERADNAARALQWRQMALVSEAVLAALNAYLSEGGGSRGARAICDPEGADVPVTRLAPLEPFRFRAERADDRARKIFVRLDGDGFVCDSRQIRRRDRTKAAYFERDWARFLSGAIFESETEWALSLSSPLRGERGRPVFKQIASRT
jgi:succinate dehydrogenase / fumarate reductase flavoprotein subunit